jgi:hypothetical protein
LTLQRAPVKGRKRISKSPALAGRSRLCGLRRPLQGRRGSPLFEADLYANAVPDLDSLPKCYSSFGPKDRPPGQFWCRSEAETPICPVSKELHQRSNGRQPVAGPDHNLWTTGSTELGWWNRPAGQRAAREDRLFVPGKQRYEGASPTTIFKPLAGQSR